VTCWSAVIARSGRGYPHRRRWQSLAPVTLAQRGAASLGPPNAGRTVCRGGGNPYVPSRNSTRLAAPKGCISDVYFWQTATIVHRCPFDTLAAAALHSSVWLHHIHRNFRRSVTIILSIFFKWLGNYATPETPVTLHLKDLSPAPYEVSTISEWNPAQAGGH